jgi:O-antigen/teichoic acid export membrane protein
LPDSISSLRRARPLIAARLVSACVTLSIPLVLARMLPLAEYGTYKQLFLLSLTASAILPLGVTQSLYFFVPRSRQPRVYLGQTLLFLLAAGSLGALVMGLAGPALAAALSNPRLADHALELAIYTGLVVAASPLETSITAQGRTGVAAICYLTFDALRAAALVLPALTGHDLHAMMAAMVAWAALRLVVAWSLTLRERSGGLWSGPLFREQLRYALPFGIAIAFAIPQQYAHQFIVAHAVGPALFALYAVACFELPFVELFYTPTSEVLMVQLGELDRAGRRAESAAAFREAVERLAALLLPPIAFVFAVAPAFITTMFGARFADAAPLFRICVLVMPLGIWPLDATLRALGETRHILASYLLKAVIAIPLVWMSVHRFGLAGAAVSFLAAELLGRVFLAWRVPASLSTPGVRVRFRDLVPARRLARSALVACALALVGLGTLDVVTRLDPVASGPLHRVLPLVIASGVFGVGYLGHLALSGTTVPGALGALFGRLGRRRLGSRYAAATASRGTRAAMRR